MSRRNCALKIVCLRDTLETRLIRSIAAPLLAGPSRARYCHCLRIDFRAPALRRRGDKAVRGRDVSRRPRSLRRRDVFAAVPREKPTFFSSVYRGVGRQGFSLKFCQSPNRWDTARSNLDARYPERFDIPESVFGNRSSRRISEMNNISRLRSTDGGEEDLRSVCAPAEFLADIAWQPGQI